MKKKRHFFLRGLLSLASGVLYVLSLPKVRDWIWKKTVGRGKEKVIDAKAKLVDADAKKDKGLLG
jgi:hypothetical protein